ncbi:MAG: hypothetical protein JW701_09760 [Kosmotogaceae bacterium]|nr:hypothetical protein [Kosmotogaceae bacterium]
MRRKHHLRRRQDKVREDKRGEENLQNIREEKRPEQKYKSSISEKRASSQEKRMSGKITYENRTYDEKREEIIAEDKKI